MVCFSYSPTPRCGALRRTQGASRYALHTVPGCFQPQDVWQTGIQGETDCSRPTGCFVSETNTDSYGEAFATAGGGVWATQFDVAGILYVDQLIPRVINFMANTASGSGMFVHSLIVGGTSRVWCRANIVPQRANLPQSILEATSTSSIDISEWGPPSASYPAPICDIPRFFSAQQLVFDITLCGIWLVAF